MCLDMPDVVVVGGGSNSLTTACYLAKAGMNVLVLEKNQQAGGGVVSEEAAPGFINDTHAMGFMTLMANPAIRNDELRLQADFGLEWLYNESPFGSLFSDGTGLISYRDIDKTCSEIAKFSEKDASSYRAFVEEVSVFLPLLLMGFYAPPMPQQGFLNLMRGSEEGRGLLRFMNVSVNEILNERFEHPVVKMHFAKWCSEMMIAPDVPGAGIAIVLILSMSHRFDLGTVKGGAKNLTNALVRCLEHHGGEIRLGEKVSKLVMESGTCVGVELESSERIRAAKSVVANIHPWRIGTMAEGVDRSLVERAKKVRLSDYGAINQQFALAEAPKWKAGPEFEKVTTLEILENDYDGFMQSFADYKAGKMPLNHLSPLVNPQSNIDPSRAPDGKCALYLYSFAPKHIEGGWDSLKEEVADALFDWFASFTKNIDANKIIGRIIETPEDHAKHSMNMMDGDIMGCAMGYGQMMGGRPMPELADYRIPGVNQLYLVGPTQHPGGTVTLGGRATAMKMLDDCGADLTKAFTIY